MREKKKKNKIENVVTIYKLGDIMIFFFIFPLNLIFTCLIFKFIAFINVKFKNKTSKKYFK